MIGPRNHVWSGDSQRFGSDWLPFIVGDCETAVSLQYFLLTYINTVRSFPQGLRSQSGVCPVPVLSPLSSRGRGSQRGYVVTACWRGTNMRLGCHFYEVFAVSSRRSQEARLGKEPGFLRHQLPILRWWIFNTFCSFLTAICGSLRGIDWVSRQRRLTVLWLLRVLHSETAAEAFGRREMVNYGPQISC